MDWSLHCSQCPATADAEGLKTVCPECGSPLLVRYARKVGPADCLGLGEFPFQRQHEGKVDDCVVERTADHGKDVALPCRPATDQQLQTARRGE